MTNAGYGEPGRRLRPSPFWWGLLATAGGLLALVGFAGVRRIGTVLIMLIAATYFAIGLDRPVAAMVRRGLRRPVAVLLVAAVGLVAACALAAAVVPAVARQVEAFMTGLPDLLTRLRGNVGAGTDQTAVALSQDVAATVTSSTLATIATGLIGGASTLLGALAFLVTTGFLTLFVLAALDRLRTGAYRLVVASRRDRIRALAGAVEEKVGGYLVGAIGIAVIAAIAAFTWCTVTGVPYPLLMSIVVGLFDLIPQIGATIGSTVVILVALSESLPLAVATLVFFCLYQGLENWLIYPRVMSRAVEISNLAAIVAAMVGWSLLGVLGVLLAVPVYASVLLIVRQVVLPRQDAR